MLIHHSASSNKRIYMKCLQYYYLVINVATTMTTTAANRGRLLLSSSLSSSSFVSAAFLLPSPPTPKPTTTSSSTKYPPLLLQQKQYHPTITTKTTKTITTNRRSFVTATTTTSLLSSSSDNGEDDNDDELKLLEELEELPTTQGVVDAHKLLTNKVVKTPLLESKLLNEIILGNNKRKRIFIKAECLQMTGSFKYRGALNRLLKLQKDNPDQAAKRGVVAFSSGNFGQALAAAATTLNMECCIVSPHDAPIIKLDRIQKYGANLILSQAKPNENREIIASKLAQNIAKTKGMTLLHPFEDIDVIHGQGTVGMEVLQQAKQLDCPISTIIVPCGGGGLTAGINLAVQLNNNQQQQQQQNNGNKNNKKKINVISVEPKGYDDHAKSFKIGQRKTLAELYPQEGDHEKSIDCDALMAGGPGIKTWEINSRLLSNAIESQGDKSAANAMKIAFEYFNLVLEPSGSLGLAAVLDGQIPDGDDDDDDDDDGAIVVIASGGNTDLTTFARLMGCTNENENENE